MAFGDDPFSGSSTASASLPTTVVPIEVRVGDDWPFVFTIKDASGTPIDLTGMVVGNGVPGGATVGAELFGSTIAGAVPITGAMGSVQIVNAAAGQVSVTVARALTALVAPQSVAATSFPVRLSVFIIDTLWRQHTFPPTVLLALRPFDLAVIPTQPISVALTSGQQGPAGPSNSFSADQIAALNAATLVSAKSYTDQQIADLPDVPTIVQGLIRNALVTYATKSDVAGSVAAATAGFVTNEEVEAAIQAFFNQQTFAPTGDALNALIDARVVAYLQRTVNLIGNAQASANLTGVLSRSSALSGALPASAAISGALDRQIAAAGVLAGSGTLSGSPTLVTPLAGTVPASAVTAGALTTQAPGSVALAGSVPASASTAATPSFSALLAGAINSTASLVGNAVVTLPLSGSIPASAGMTGMPSQSIDLAGTTSALAILTGNASYSVVLSGSVISSATLSGVLSKTLGVTGTTPASAGLTGTLTAANANRHPLFGFGLLGAAA